MQGTKNEGSERLLRQGEKREKRGRKTGKCEMISCSGGPQMIPLYTQVSYHRLRRHHPAQRTVAEVMHSTKQIVTTVKLAQLFPPQRHRHVCLLAAAGARCFTKLPRKEVETCFGPSNLVFVNRLTPIPPTILHSWTLEWTESRFLPPIGQQKSAQ